MKKNKQGLLLSLAALLTGLIAMSLRRMLYLSAMDEKGLLRRFSLPEGGLLLLTAVVLVLLLMMVYKGSGSRRYKIRSGTSIPGALGHLAAAVGLLLTVRGGTPAASGSLMSLWNILGYVSAGCLLLAGGLRLWGKKPFFLLHVIPSLFFMVHIVNQYQLWSSNPQMQDYLFALLGALALALFSYYTAAMEAGCGNIRLYLGTGFGAVYLCLAELAWSDWPALYLGGMLWALTELGRVVTGTARKKD